MDEDVLMIPGLVEEVNVPLLTYLYETDDDIVVFFYEATDRDADEIIDVLEKIDNVLDKDNISLVKIDDEGAEDQYGLSELPALVYLQNGIPNMYQGSLMDAKAILKWLKEEAKIVRMHEVTDIVLRKLVEKFDYLAAVFYDSDDDPVLQNLQKIAADSQKNGVAMVKVNDDEEARGAIQYSPENCPQKCPELSNCINSYFLGFFSCTFRRVFRDNFGDNFCIELHPGFA